MSDLISIGRSGVLAYQGALAAVGENVTNANTEGYAKRNVVLKEQTTASGPQYLAKDVANFNGVQPLTIARAFDQYKAQAAWSATSDDSYASTRSQYLTSVQTQLNDGNTGIGTKLTAIFTTASALGANPTDTTLRQTMIYAVQDAVTSIGQAAANVDKVSATVDQQASAQVDALNTALQNLAKINVTLRTAPQGSSGRAAVEDQRDGLISSISSMAGVDVTLDPKGAVTLKLSNYGGPVLVSPTTSVASFVRMNTASDGKIALTLQAPDGNTVPATPTSGSLAGLIDSASTAADRKNQLDGLANNLATSLNGWQQQGLDANGNPGTDMLTSSDPSGVITAKTLTLTANFDPNQIAAADMTAANGNLLALPALRGSTGVEAQWHNIVNDQALQVSAAATAATTAAAQKDSALTAQDSTSGVNLDNEAAELLRFQQAYSASSKIIQAAKDTFQAILALF